MANTGDNTQVIRILKWATRHGLNVEQVGDLYRIRSTSTQNVQGLDTTRTYASEDMAWEALLTAFQNQTQVAA
jgi:hypothetical protein